MTELKTLFHTFSGNDIKECGCNLTDAQWQNRLNDAVNQTLKSDNSVIAFEEGEKWYIHTLSHRGVK